MKKNNFGFTLIELLVVIAIIGILVTIVIVAIDPVRQIQNSQDARMRSDLQQIKAAFQLYYNDNKSYPVGTTMVGSGASNCWSSGVGCTGTIYMKQVPKDISGSAYRYQGLTGTAACNAPATSCSDYTVGAVLNRAGTDDTLTLTKCTAGTGIGSPPANFEVCND